MPASSGEVHVVKLTSKGQLTLPIEIRRRLGMSDGDHLAVRIDGDGVRLDKIAPARPLSDADPIWRMIGAGDSERDDTSEQHDRHLAAEERAKWQRS